MEPDYYKILGVREDASEEEIKKTYRITAKKYHPDANRGDDRAAEIFKEISEAYAVIGNGESRKEYDRRRAAETRGRAGGQYGSGGETAAKSREHGGVAPGARYSDVTAGFEQFFGFNPKTKEAEEKKMNPNKKTKANPIDMTEMFERYMGIKKK